MRKQFVECQSQSTAKRRCPWAAVIAKAQSGFWCFESIADYEAWQGQK
jgi:hypothetical protein